METLASIQVGRDEEGRRLDRVIRRLLPRHSLGDVYRLIRTGRIRVNGRRSKPADRLAAGDRISIADADAARYLRDREARGPDASPAGGHGPRMPPVIYESEHILALNKPRGVLVHGSDSLLHTVRTYLAAGHAPSLTFRPGPVHRLDRNTSGLIVFAASLQGAREMSALLRAGKVRKHYLAVLSGSLAGPTLWRDRLVRDADARKSAAARKSVAGGGGATHAETQIEPLRREGAMTLCLCRPITGRTHQIRAQAAAHGNPLAGDRKYRGLPVLPHYVLHCAGLDATEPPAGIELPPLYAPLPTETAAALAVVFGDDAISAALEKIRLAMRM
jgi:23S rRNA pseudouridine955/2504/2580 synthase